MALAFFIFWFAVFIVPIAIVVLVISLFVKKKSNSANQPSPGFTNKDRVILLLGLIVLTLIAWPFISLYLKH